MQKNYYPPENSWAYNLPEKELYDVYKNTVGSRFPAFGIRDFEDARYDMAQPYHAHDPSIPINRDILDLIVTPESHARYKTDLEEHAEKHGLKGWIEYGGSVVYVTDHGQFTDVPVTAESIGDIGLGSRSNTIQVISSMITIMELDLKGIVSVINPLRNISAIVQTVPRLDGDSTEGLIAYRKQRNESGIKVLKNVRDTPGSISILSIVGRHNQPSNSGKSLFIHEPNRETLRAYMSSRVKVVPVYMDCPTFDNSGNVVPANMHSELFAPMEITDSKKDTKRIMQMFRGATARAVGSNYKHGVKIRTWNAQQAKRNALALKRKITQDSKTPLTDNY